MMEGWIKIHRCIEQNDIWLSEPFSRGQAWVDLILLANHKESFFYKRGNKVVVKRGQVGRSEVELAARWRWSRTKVRKFLEDLQKEQQIEITKSPITQLVTIINYDVYQEKEQQKDSRKTTEEQQKNTYKNDKKEKNDKNIQKEREEKELALSLKNSELEKQLLEANEKLKTLEAEKEKEKSSAKKEKEPHKFPPTNGKPAAKLNPPKVDVPPHKIDIEQEKLKQPKPYELDIQDYEFKVWSDKAKEEFFIFCEEKYSTSKGKFSGTQARQIIKQIERDIFQYGIQKVENCLVLCNQRGWNYDIKYQINKESREKQDEHKRNKQQADDSKLSTVELAVRDRFPELFAEIERENGYNSSGQQFDNSEQEF